MTDSKGQATSGRVNDFVRLETAAALSRDIPVVPVIVQDAVMPNVHELPDALKELAFRNGTELTHARWDSDVKLLIEDLKPYLEKPTQGAAMLKPPSDAAVITTTTCSRSVSAPLARRRSLWSKAAAIAISAGIVIVGYDLSQDGFTAQDRTFAHAHTSQSTESRSDIKPATRISKPAVKTADESEKLDPTSDRAEVIKADAAKTAAVRRAADQRKRQEIERAAMLAEEQRKLDEQSRRIAQEQAEKNRIAAEQAGSSPDVRRYRCSGSR